jgi:cell fate (sporulation/competence/biofilm development) regulator YlbF (YheA/YmcA/DUF963 family)
LQAFATALRDTPSFTRFEQAALTLDREQSAHQALTAYKAKLESLDVLIKLNALNAEDRAELEHLERVVNSNKTIAAYVQAQAELVDLCCALNNQISNAVGMRFAVKRGGCCG